MQEPLFTLSALFVADSKCMHSSTQEALTWEHVRCSPDTEQRTRSCPCVAFACPHCRHGAFSSASTAGGTRAIPIGGAAADEARFRWSHSSEDAMRLRNPHRSLLADAPHRRTTRCSIALSEIGDRFFVSVEQSVLADGWVRKYCDGSLYYMIISLTLWYCTVCVWGNNYGAIVVAWSPTLSLFVYISAMYLSATSNIVRK